MQDILGEKKSLFCLQFHVAICCSREVTVVEAGGHILSVVKSRVKQMHEILPTYFPIAFSSYCSGAPTWGIVLPIIA